jgi:hypothetical protein
MQLEHNQQMLNSPMLDQNYILIMISTKKQIPLCDN